MRMIYMIAVVVALASLAACFDDPCLDIGDAGIGGAGGGVVDAAACTNDDLCIDHAWCNRKYGMTDWLCYDEQHCCPPGVTPP